MKEPTQNEINIAEEIRKHCKDLLSEEALDSLNKLTIHPIIRGDNKRDILLVKVHEEVVDMIQYTGTLCFNRIKSMYPDCILVIVRDLKIFSVPKRKRFNYPINAKNTKRNVHESWIRDICYPALVEMRQTVVHNENDKVEVAFINRLSGVAEDELSAMAYTYTVLTGGEDIRYEFYLY